MYKRQAVTYVIEGGVSDEELQAIKNHCINPVDSRETGLEKPETLVTVFPEPEDVKIFDGFKDMPEAECPNTMFCFLRCQAYDKKVRWTFFSFSGHKTR